MLRPLQFIATALVLSLGMTLAPVAGDQPERGGQVAAAGTLRDAYSVRLATHNIKCERCGGDWAWRARRSAQMVRNNKVQVVAFQEVGPTQLKILRNQLPGHRFWPKRKFGGNDSQNQIAWDHNRYRPLNKGKIRVPVRGYWRVMPWVKLKVRNRHRGGGRVFFVFGFHNSPNGREWERDRATEIQIDLINDKVRHKSGTPRPVFMMGDANERSEFCRKVRRNTPLIAMNGTWRNPCPVPPGGPDWMVGNKRGVIYRDFQMVPAFESMHDFMTIRAQVRRSSTGYWSG